jgi:hypothetical protein
MKKLTNKLAAIALVGMTMAGAFGCAYAGIAAAPDGTVYVARNDGFLFGILRKFYVCKPAGAALACSEVPSPP